MASRTAVLALSGIAACSFHRLEPATGDGAPGNGGAPDAPSDAAKLGPDAKQFHDAQTVAGMLSVTPTALGQTDIGLSAEGTLDWAHWGFTSATSFDHENGGTAISDVTVVGGGTQLSIVGTAVSASWSNGTPDATASQTGTGTGVSSPAGLRLTAPAGTARHTLRVYVGNRDSSGRLDVALSDNSATAYTNMQSGGTPASHTEYTIVYNAATDGQTLTVTWTDTGDTSGGFVMLLSATLQ